MEDFDIDKFIDKHYKKIILIFVVLIFISRIYKFGELPTAIGIDEAGSAYDAHCIANYGVDRYLNSFPIYFINFGGGQSALYTYLNALLIKILNIENIIISRLPALIFFILAIFISYKLVDKMKDKKTAILLAFLIIVSPWQIEQSRFGLDCNLLGPLFILDLYLLENAKKNYHYIFAGISIGITLYTYSLSWIIIPVFLLVWASYNIYIKKVKWKQLLILGCTILVFALPLIYFIIINKGYATNTQIGIFTIPKLDEFRANEIAISNILKNGWKSILTIFTSQNTVYYFEIPFFIIGIIMGIKDSINSIRKKEYSFITIMTLTTITIFIMNLFIWITTSNRANILYIPILYFVALGITEIIKNRAFLWGILIAIYLIAFINFEIVYYTKYAMNMHSRYENIGLTQILDYINENKIKSESINIYSYQGVSPAIFIINHDKMSPYKFMEEYKYKEERINNNIVQATFKLDKYFFDNYPWDDLSGNVKYDENKIYIIENRCDSLIKLLEDTEYEEKVFNEYHLFYEESINSN